MVEVFKTNVRKKNQAQMVVDILLQSFQDYKINFDLDDCDNVLRIENENGVVEPLAIIQIVEKSGYIIEVLPEEHFNIITLLPEQFLNQY